LLHRPLPRTRTPDFPELLKRIPDAYMSRLSTMVIPSKSLRLALGVICSPILARFMDARSAAVERGKDS
jgi:phosphoribulokinase